MPEAHAAERPVAHLATASQYRLSPSVKTYGKVHCNTGPIPLHIWLREAKNETDLCKWRFSRADAPASSAFMRIPRCVDAWIPALPAVDAADG